MFIWHISQIELDNDSKNYVQFEFIFLQITLA